MSQAKKIKEFYNNNFFEKGKAQEAHLILTFEAGKEKITIPGIKVQPNTTIEAIFRAYHAYLSQSQQDPTKEENQPKIINIEQIEYKNNTYLVEQIGEEEFVVRNQETGKILSKRSPVFKILVKRFKGETLTSK